MPYGGKRNTGTITAANYHFTDQEWEPETGLYNYDARLYDPVIGRFVSADPYFSPKIDVGMELNLSLKKFPYIMHFVNPQNLNRFSYCSNNPLIYNDPSGLDYILLNDPTGARDEGHNAILVGNDRTGWNYYSKDGKGENNNSHNSYDSYDQFRQDTISNRYTREKRMPTTEIQDENMTRYGTENFNRPYSVVQDVDESGNITSENCADLAFGIGREGGVYITDPKDSRVIYRNFTDPNEQYDEFESNNRNDIFDSFNDKQLGL